MFFAPTPLNMWTRVPTPNGNGTITFLEVLGYYKGKHQYQIFLHDSNSGLLWECGI